MAAGLLLSSGVVWQASDAAFSDTTSNTGNGVSATTLNLADDSTGRLFSVANATPGATGTNCIQISSASTPSCAQGGSTPPVTLTWEARA
ncbi:hypothetical protein [Actinophytocola sp.]|uniref:hypothetical protein n=1 Tax=Actinophytocola sp. TaxID=1872138 RepID=UPI002ED5F328